MDAVMKKDCLDVAPRRWKKNEVSNYCEIEKNKKPCVKWNEGLGN